MLNLFENVILLFAVPLAAVLKVYPFWCGIQFVSLEAFLAGQPYSSAKLHHVGPPVNCIQVNAALYTYIASA